MNNGHGQGQPGLDTGPQSVRASVGVPVYNGERYLEEALSSIAAQTLEDIEVLVCDNASTDRSREIVLDLAQGDPRIRLIENAENVGAAANYNRVAREAVGTYFRWAPCDDRMRPRLLEACCEALDETPQAVLAYPKTLLIDAEGDSLGPYEDRMHLDSPDVAVRTRGFVSRINLCNAVLGVYRRAALLQSPLIRPFVGSDALLLYWAVLSGQVIEVPEALFERRMHDAASHEAAPTLEALRLWFDPRREAGLLDRLRPRQRLLLEYLALTRRSDLPRPDQLRVSWGISLAWLLRRTRVNLGSLKNRILDRDRGHEVGIRFP